VMHRGDLIPLYVVGAMAFAILLLGGLSLALFGFGLLT